MSGAPYDRWYIVPSVEFERWNGTENAPKYSENTGIEGIAGNTVEPSIIEDSYPALIQIYPDVSEWYIVRLYGTWAALNDISVKQDTRNLATNPSDVAAVLNQRFPDLDRSPEEWSEGFFIGPPTATG